MSRAGREGIGEGEDAGEGVRRVEEEEEVGAGGVSASWGEEGMTSCCRVLTLRRGDSVACACACAGGGWGE